MPTTPVSLMGEMNVTTPQQFDPQAFLEFCRGKPRDETYKRANADCCALAQFGYPGIHTTEAEEMGILPIFEAIFADNTFGSLADRLEAALAEQSGL